MNTSPLEENLTLTAQKSVRLNLPAEDRHLNARELEVLMQIADGLTSPQIAAKFSRSGDSVEAHRKSIIKKLGARNAPHAVALAFRNNLIQ